MSLTSLFESFRRNKGCQWTVFCPLPQEEDVKTLVRFINKGRNRVSYIRHSEKTDYFKKLELLVFLVDREVRDLIINDKPTVFVNLKTKEVKLNIPINNKDAEQIIEWKQILQYMRKCKYISFGIECYKKGGDRKDAVKIMKFINSI